MISCPVKPSIRMGIYAVHQCSSGCDRVLLRFDGCRSIVQYLPYATCYATALKGVSAATKAAAVGIGRGAVWKSVEDPTMVCCMIREMWQARRILSAAMRLPVRGHVRKYTDIRHLAHHFGYSNRQSASSIFPRVHHCQPRNNNDQP